MKDIERLLTTLAGYTVLIVLGVAYVKRWITHYKTGSITGVSGGTYPYALGDRLHYVYTTGTFNGIDIVLPAILPNIFLYGKVHQRVVGPRHFVTKNQRLGLEGNFNRSFICYAPRSYEVLALSLLTPDVMQTLLMSVPDCDVEFYRDHVRIMVRHRVYGKAEAEARLLGAADRLMQEVDHKLRSWTTADSEEARDALLVSEDNPVVRLFGQNYRLSTFVLGPIYGTLGFAAWIVTLLELSVADHVTLGWIVSRFWLPFFVFPVSWIAIVIGVPRDWYTKPLLSLLKWYISVRSQ